MTKTLLVLLLSGLCCAAQPLRIGAEDDWFPYSGLVKGQAAGFSVELVQAAFAQAGIQVQLVPLPYARCMQLTRKSQLAGCFNTLRNPLLELQYRWHKQALFRGRIDIYARQDHPPGSIDLQGLRGKLIGVTNGYDYGAAFDGDKSFRRDVGNSDLHALRKLVAGRIDYALVYDRIAQHLLQEHPELRGRFKSVGTLIEPEIYLSFARNYPGIEQIIQRFDAGLEKVYTSGEYEVLDQRWR